jgi:hypothetical protein
VKKVLVDAFTFEVARAMDGNGSGQIGGDFDGKQEQRRLMAIILALRDLGLVTADDDDHAISICFSAEAKELRGDVSDERLWELERDGFRFGHMFRFGHIQHWRSNWRTRLVRRC